LDKSIFDFAIQKSGIEIVFGIVCCVFWFGLSFLSPEVSFGTNLEAKITKQSYISDYANPENKAAICSGFLEVKNEKKKKKNHSGLEKNGVRGCERMS